MPRPRIYDDDLAARLVEAAADLLAAEGPHALTTRRVAAAAGTTTNALYTLIGGKEELLREIYREGFGRLARAFEAVPETDDPLADYRALGRAYLDHALANPAFYEVMFHCPAPEFAPTAADAAFAFSTFQTNIDRAQRCVDAGIFAGDAAVIATRVWASTHGVASLALAGLLPLDQAPGHYDAICDALCACFLAPDRHAVPPAS